MQAFWSVFAVLFVFGLVVCFHELGHFLVAKWCGIGVEIFSFGMGPRAFGKKLGETDYRVSWLPLGGYVKMQGDEETEGGGMAAAQGGGDRPDPARADRKPERDYERHPKWQRLAVMAAGAFFNFALTLLIFTATFYGEQITPLSDKAPAVIVDLDPDGPAAAAGLRQGDTLLRIGDAPVPDSASALFEIQTGTRGAYDVTYTREGAERTGRVTPKLDKFKGETIGSLGVYLPAHTAVFGTPAPGSPAAAAGVRSGDILCGAEGRPLREYLRDGQVIPLRDPARTALRITVLRGGQPVELALERAAGVKLWGLQLGEPHFNGPAGALREAVRRMKQLSTTLYSLVRKMAGGRSSARGLSGPLGIIRMIGGTQFETPGQFFGELLGIAAFISLQLGIMNLLPIPALDGGHILILLLEGVTRREFSRGAKEKIIAAGFFLLLGLIAVLVVSDVLKIFHK